MGKRGYRLSPLAETDLENIWLYTFKTWSLEQADSYHAGLIAVFDGLAAGDKIGRKVDIQDGYFKCLIGSHLIFFRITDHNIDIMRILHQKMDVNLHL